MITNSVQYKIDNLGDAKSKLKIGGSDKDKFVPNLNVSFFSDEFYFNLNRRDKVVTNQTASLNSGKVTQKIDTETDEYYIDADGHFKWDIVFDAKPSKMDIVWDIEHTEGIEFFYQPELTAEEISNGAFRPDNVIGSYAVYCSKANNKYKTGKICHIYRPFVIDVNGKKEWAVLEIKNKKLTITLPESFMQTAVYPVRLDPTFGYTSVGASSIGYNTIKIGIADTTDASGGVVNSYHCAIAAVDGTNPGIKIGIYNCNQADGNPKDQSPVETYVEWDVSVSDDESIASIDGSTLAANTKYNISWIPESGSTKIKYDSSAGYEPYYVSGRTYANEMTDPWHTSSSSGTWTISAWIDYGGGGSTYNESISESNSISDVVGSLAVLGASIAESNTISDGSNSASILNSIISELISVSDDISSAATLLAAISELNTISDLQSALYIFTQSILESIGISESQNALKEITDTVSDSLNISDSVSALAEFITAISENISITDLFAAISGNDVIISESLNVTDNYSSIAELVAAISESATATDNLNAIAILLANISEATTIADLINAGNIYLETVNESVTIADLISVMTAISKYISATMTIKNKLSADMEVRGIISGELTATGKIKGVLQ